MRKLWLVMMWVVSYHALVYSEALDKVVAVVNDNVITASELQSQVEILRQQYRARHMPIPEEAALRKQVLQHLIDVDLQLQLAKNNDISVDNRELDQTISKIAGDNHLSLDALRQEVEKQGLAWEVYRENIRKELTISRIQQRSVSHEVVVSSEQVEDYLSTFLTNEKAKQTYRVQNIVIPLPEEPTTEQLNKARNKAQALLLKLKQGEDFSRLAIMESSGEYALEGGDLGERHLAELPEIFAHEVEKMKINEVSGPLRTGNGFQLIKLVSIGHDAEHHKVTKTHVRHILLKQDVSTTTEEAHKKIENLYQQLKSGKDFGLMAKQYSLDAASAVKGGDLGWVTADELVPQFSKAMEALPLNEISKPVQSPFGWHLIQVLERKEIDDSDSYQRQQARQFLQQRKFSEAVQNWQQHIRTDAYVKILDKALA